MKLVVTRYSPVTWYFLSCKPKYFPNYSTNKITSHSETQLIVENTNIFYLLSKCLYRRKENGLK